MKDYINEFDFLSVLLRFTSLSGKFLLILFMAKYLSSSEVGEWGIITNFLIFSTFIIGAELYTYYTIEIGKRIPHHSKKIIYMALSSTLIKISFFYFILFFLYNYFFNFFSIYSNSILILLFLEPISQEVFRLHIALGNVRIANLILAIRSGIWCFIILLFWYLNQDITLNDILYIWALFSLLSIIIGLKNINFIKLKKIINITRYKLKWLIASFKKSFYYFISGVGLRSVYFLDKIILLQFTNMEIVGVYTFYQTVFLAINSFMDAGLIAKFYSNYTKLFYTKNNYNKMSLQLHQKLKTASIFVFLLLIGGSIIIQIALLFINKKIYEENILIFYILISASLPYTVSQFYQIALNIMKQGKFLFFANTISIALFLLTLYILLYFDFRLLGASIAFVIFSLSMLISKMFFYYKTINHLTSRSIYD